MKLDDELACSGTVRRFSDEGHEVFIFWLGNGRPAQTFGEQAEQEIVKEKVLALLGAKEIVVQAPALEDNQFDKVALLNIVQRVEAAIEEVKPSAIISHTEKCLNVDHEITARAVRTAIARRPEIKEVYACEVPSSTEWAGKAFNPTYFVDITGLMNVKFDVLWCYESEMRAYPHPRSIKGIEALAQYRGMQCGCEAAEGFEVVRMVDRNAVEV